jgi:hypothetical protein
MRLDCHIQCNVKSLSTLLIWLAIPTCAAAYPIKPDTKTLLKAYDRQDNDFPPARVGWQQKPPQPVNPVLESLRYPYTREAMAAQITEWVTPDWRLMALFGLLIFTLRYYRERRLKPQSALPPPVPIREERPVEPRLAA